MKKLILPIMAVCLAGFLIPASAQNNGDDGGGPPMPPPGEAPPGAPGSGAAGQSAPGQSPSLPAGAIRFVQPNHGAQTTSPQNLAQTTALQTPSAFVPPNDSGGASNPDQLRLNFDNVPLDMVLNYLSDAAGFIIVMNTQVHGNVSVISSHPMTRDEAVDLLNAVLNQNGYAAVRNGRTLTIMDKSAAKNSDIPVQIGSNPAEIPRNDEIVTQIIPIRYVDATQLVSDLSSFVSPEATIVANQAGNSIVITDTQQNIHHLVEIISAIDQSAAGETEIQVFTLKYANPNDVASELGEIFPSGNPTGPGNSPIRFGGFPGGGFGGGGFGGGGGFFGRMMAAAAANGGGNNNRAQKQSQVTAVADARTQSVIVMASKDLMYEIAGMMQSLDVPSQRDQGVYSFSLHNADPQEVAQVLQNMFQSSSSGRGSGQSSSQQQETSPFMNREAQNATTVSTTSSTISSSSANSNGRVGGGGGGGVP